MAQTRGRNSLQYRVIRELSSDLATGIRDGFMGVATKALEKALITEETHKSLIDQRQDVLGRSTEFVSVIRRRVELDVGAFDTFLDILRSEPALCAVADMIEKKLTDSGYSETDSVDGEELAPPTSTKDEEEAAQEEGVAGSATKETLPALYAGSANQSALIVGKDVQPHCSPLEQIKESSKQLEAVLSEKDRTILYLSRKVTEGKGREKKLEDEVHLLHQQKQDIQRWLEISEQEKKNVVEEKEAAVNAYKKEIELHRLKISQMEEDNRQIVNNYESQITDLNKKIDSLNQMKDHAELQLHKEEAQYMRMIMELKDKLFKVENEEKLLRIRLADEQRQNAELIAKNAEEKQHRAEKRACDAENTVKKLRRQSIKHLRRFSCFV